MNETIAVTAEANAAAIRSSLRECGYEVLMVRSWTELRDAMKHDPAAYLMAGMEPDGVQTGLTEALKLHRSGRRVIWIGEEAPPEGITHLPATSHTGEIVDTLSKRLTH